LKIQCSLAVATSISDIKTISATYFLPFWLPSMDHTLLAESKFQYTKLCMIGVASWLVNVTDHNVNMLRDTSMSSLNSGLE
jgi:hypothetical protein